MAALLSVPSLAFPPVTLVLLFGAAYVGLLFGATGIARRVKTRLPLRGFALVAISLAACGTGWFLFNRLLLQPSPALVDASLARMRSGDDRAFVTEKVGLFSARPATASLSFATPDVLVNEVPPFAAAARSAGEEPAALVSGQRSAVPVASLRRYGGRLFAAGGVVPMPVSFAADTGEESTHVTVANGSALWLRGTFLWRRGRAWPLGDIAPGATLERSLSSDDSVDLRSPPALRGLLGSDQRARFWGLVASDDAGQGAVLVAWLDQPGLRATVNGAQRPPGVPAVSLLMVQQS